MSSRNAPVGPGDARRTKRALVRLGFMEGDKFAGNEFPTEGMFAGLKSFQRASGLRADGAMKPGGPAGHAARLWRFGRPVGAEPAFGRSAGAARPGGTGHLEPGQMAGDIADIDLSMGIQPFHRDFNLKRDGAITPGGERTGVDLVLGASGGVAGIAEAGSNPIHPILPPAELTSMKIVG